MNHNAIKAALQVLVASMLNKGIKQPQAKYEICGQTPGNMTLWCSVESKQFDGQYLKFFHGETPLDQIDAARAYIDALPDPATEGERLFTKKLAEAVDIATEYSLPDAAIIPVRAAIREVNAVLLSGPS